MSVPITCPTGSESLSPSTLALGVTVQVYLIPLVVTFVLLTVMDVAVLSQMVSSTALITTVGSTHMSTVIGVPAHSLSSSLLMVHGVMVYCTSCLSLLVLSSV